MRRLWDWRVLAVVPTIALCAALTTVGALLDTYPPHRFLLIVFLVPLTAGSLLAWLLLARRDRRDLFVYCGLVGVAGLLYGWSQLRPDSVGPPPIVEWAVATTLVGLVAWYVTVAVRQRSTRLWLLPPLLVLLGLCPACCFAGLVNADDADVGSISGLVSATFDSTNGVDRIMSPLPADTKLVERSCHNYGSHGKCWEIFVVAATDGADRAELRDRIVAEYRARGWPLQPSRFGAFEGCRPMRGIVAWDELCMFVDTTLGTNDPYRMPDPSDPVRVVFG